MASEVVQPVHLVVLVFFLAASFVFSQSIFRPLRERTPTHASTRYRITELLILTSQLAFIGLLTFEPFPEEGVVPEVAGLTVLWVLVGWWWWLGVRLLSRAGVEGNFRRAIFLLFVVPCTYGWSLVAVCFNPIMLILAFLPALLAGLLLFFLLRICQKVVTWVADESSSSEIAVEQSFFKRFAAILLSIGIGVVALWVITLPVRTGDYFYYKSVARRTYLEMRRHAEVQEIQAWLSSLPEDRRASVEKVNWPPCIRNLSPGYVHFDDEGNVRISWGSGFGHWGLCVGPEAMQTPETDAREYRIPLKKGAYVWHEIQ